MVLITDNYLRTWFEFLLQKFRSFSKFLVQVFANLLFDPRLKNLTSLCHRIVQKQLCEFKFELNFRADLSYF